MGHTRKYELNLKLCTGFLTVYKNKFLFRIKDKCCPFNYQHLSLGQEHQVYNTEDSFNIEDRWQLHSWDFLRLPQRKTNNPNQEDKKTQTTNQTKTHPTKPNNTKTPIILKSFENSQRNPGLDKGKLDCLVCKANDKTFQECTVTP